MAAPLQTAKSAVDLASTAVRGSRIRRDPVPEVKELEVRDQNERDAWTVAIGVVAFALAIVIITFGVASAAGWSPAHYVIHG